jgi:hypothetical protein
MSAQSVEDLAMLAELPLATTQRWPEWIVSSRPSQSVIAPPALRTIGAIAQSSDGSSPP